MSSVINRRAFLKLLALVPAVAAAPRLLAPTIGEPSSQSQPNVLVLVFDTLSSQNMSLYGYPRNTTPNLSRFADKATVYHSHYAAGNFTSPGTASILTGTYPWSHRGFGFEGTVAANFEDKNLFKPFAAAGYHRLAYTHNWLAVTILNQFRSDLNVFKPMRDLCLVDDESSDRLFPNDYNVAFSSENLLLRRSAIGTSSLFLSLLERIRRSQDLRTLSEKYGDLFPRGIPTVENVSFVLEDAIDWLKSELSNSPRPFLKYIHLLPPHEPYDTRKEFVDRFNDSYKPVAKKKHFFGCCMDQKYLNLMRREYDEYLAYADAEFGRLYDFMAPHRHSRQYLRHLYLRSRSNDGEAYPRSRNAGFV